MYTLNQTVFLHSLVNCARSQISLSIIFSGSFSGIMLDFCMSEFGVTIANWSLSSTQISGLLFSTISASNKTFSILLNVRSVLPTVLQNDFLVILTIRSNSPPHHGALPRLNCRKFEAVARKPCNLSFFNYLLRLF